MNAISNRLRAVRSAIWSPKGVTSVVAILGGLGWMFLTAPYALSSWGCVGPNAVGLVDLGCLRPVAAQLRADANFATYITATVAAVIAYQLSRRGENAAKEITTNPGDHRDSEV